MRDANPLAPSTLAALLQASPRANPTRMRRLALAAIRETFEETGLVIGRKAAAPAGLKGPWAEFAATGHLPDLSVLEYIARAITPPRRLKRFDTRFFVADSAAIAHEVPGVVTSESELTELAWLTFAETEKLPLPVITRVMLGELQTWLGAAEPQSRAAIPFYFERHGRMQRVLLDQNGGAGSGPR
jgi:8-oxo-dGTP pyrophosphatase MutT (NUDIX family)